MIEYKVETITPDFLYDKYGADGINALQQLFNEYAKKYWIVVSCQQLYSGGVFVGFFTVFNKTLVEVSFPDFNKTSS